MGIKFAKDVVKQIKERGPIKIPNGSVTGEDFQQWLIDRRACITPEYTSSEKDCCESSVEK